MKYRVKETVTASWLFKGQLVEGEPLPALGVLRITKGLSHPICVNLDWFEEAEEIVLVSRSDVKALFEQRTQERKMGAGAFYAMLNSLPTYKQE